MRISYSTAFSVERFLNIELVPNLSVVESIIFCWECSKGEI